MNHKPITYLNGLRGLAALVVVFSHMFFGFYPALHTGDLNQSHNGIELLIAKSPLNIIYNGGFAVSLFFVLSGYVLSAYFFQTGKHSYLIENAIKRYLRLVIPVLFSVILAYLILRLDLFYNQKIAQISRSDWLSNFWNFNHNLNIMLSEGSYKVFLYGDCTYNRVLWTMTYEFFGSFLTFATAILVGQLRHRFWLYFIIILITIDTYYFLFILGVFLSDFFQRPVIKQNNYPLLTWLFLGIGLFFGSYPSIVSIDDTIYSILSFACIKNPVIFYHGCGAFLVLLSILLSTKLQSFFSNFIFMFLGKISFSLYLIHLIGICSFSCYIFMHLLNWFSYFTAFVTTLILSLSLFMCIAYVVYNYIDKVGIKLSKEIYLKYFALQKTLSAELTYHGS